MKKIFTNIIENIKATFPSEIFINITFFDNRIVVDPYTQPSEQFKFDNAKDILEEEINEFKDEIKKVFPESFIGNINSTSNDFIIINTKCVKEKLQKNKSSISICQAKTANDVLWKFYLDPGRFFLSPSSSLEFLRLLESQELLNEFHEQYLEAVDSSLFDLAQVIKIKKDIENILNNLDLKFTPEEQLYFEMTKNE